MRRHRRDPQRRKSSIIPGALGEPAFFSDSSPRLWGTGPVASIPAWAKPDHPWEVIWAAYARSGLFERRRILMDGSARYLAKGSVKDSEDLR